MDEVGARILQEYKDELDALEGETRQKIREINLSLVWWYWGSAWLAALSWLNFFALFWVVLFDLLPEQVSGSFVGLAALIFFLLAMGASMIAYQGGGK